MTAHPRSTLREGLLGLTLLMCCAAEAFAESIRIAGSSWVADTPTKVADANGHFNDASTGPPIQLVRYPSGAQALDSLLAGESDFALAASTPVAAALLRAAAGTGPSIVVLAAVSRSNSTHLIVADADAGIEQPSDLAGQHVGVMTGTSSHFGWDQFAHHHGLDQGQVTVVPIPVDQQAEAVRRGRVQAVATWEPWASALAEALGDRARQFTTRHLYTVSWLLVSRPEVLQRHPGLAERVLTAYVKAIDDIERDPRQAMAIHRRFTPSATASSGDDVIWGLHLDWAMVADIETQLAWWIDIGSTPLAQPPSPASYLLAAPLRAVSPRSIALPDYFFEDPAPTP